MSKITDINAIEVLDSRGNPTIKVTVHTENCSGAYTVPSGASTGQREAIELRDGENRYAGKGVNKAIKHLGETIKPLVVGTPVFSQEAIDTLLINHDGTNNKSRFGANTILGVSIAIAICAAKESKTPLYSYLDKTYSLGQPDFPLFYVNMINGGKHGDDKLAFQEYHLTINNNKPSYVLEKIHSLKSNIKKQIQEKYHYPGTGDEGGFILSTDDIEAPLSIFKQATKDLNLEDEVTFGLDVAASSFYENNQYSFKGKSHTKEEMLKIYEDLIKEHPLTAIEDPFEENDWEGFTQFKKQFPDILTIGDDLTVTNEIYLKKAIELDSIGGLIIKPNQIGTLTETIRTIKLAKENNIKHIISHRSGETNSSFIADLAYATAAHATKAGGLSHGERITKYNRFLEIEANQ